MQSKLTIQKKIEHLAKMTSGPYTVKQCESPQDIFIVSGFIYLNTGSQDKRSHESDYQLHKLNQGLSIQLQVCSHEKWPLAAYNQTLTCINQLAAVH